MEPCTIIIPKSIISAFALGTEELISDSNELSETCARSLTVRSKPSSARTWSLKWKRDSWTRLLYGRISSDSRSKDFTEKWISSLGATPANLGLPQGEDSERTTPDTSGHGSQKESKTVDQNSACSRTSKDTSRWDSPQSSAIWKSWVTRCRGEYSARLKSALHTKESESSSSPEERTGWPTPHTNCHTGPGQQGRAGGPNLQTLVACWPTPLATDGSKGGPNQKGGKGDLRLSSSVRMWPTATARDWKDSPGMSISSKNPDGSHRDRTDLLPRMVYSLGQQDQANNNTGGSLQEQSESQKGGLLNPRWVETLMGLPVGWTMPSCTYPSTTGRTN